MGGKVVMMTILLVSLVLGQVQGQVINTICCPTAAARIYFNRCRLAPLACAANSGCLILFEVQRCPPGYPHDILENTGDNAVNEYCKLGCVSSACGAITTLQNSDSSEVVNGAVEKCTNACSDFCTKGSISAVETA